MSKRGGGGEGSEGAKRGDEEVRDSSTRVYIQIQPQAMSRDVLRTHIFDQ